MIFKEKPLFIQIFNVVIPYLAEKVTSSMTIYCILHFPKTEAQNIAFKNVMNPLTPNILHSCISRSGQPTQFFFTF